VLIDDPRRFDGEKVIDVDDLVWRHPTRRQVGTVMIDLTRSGRAPARHGYWTWSRAGPSRRSSSGWPNARRLGAIRSRWLRWTASLGSRPPQPKNYPTPTTSWPTSTPRTSNIPTEAVNERPNTSTAASSASATSPTTSPDHVRETGGTSVPGPSAT